MFPMPNVVGMGTETARGILASQGLILGQVSTAVSSEPVGSVMFQYPEEGMPVVEGDTVTLIVAGRAADKPK
jgi:beta-lactam-binding protein with PASTA domain